MVDGGVAVVGGQQRSKEVAGAAPGRVRRFRRETDCRCRLPRRRRGVIALRRGV